MNNFFSLVTSKKEILLAIAFLLFSLIPQSYGADDQQLLPVDEAIAKAQKQIAEATQNHIDRDKRAQELDAALTAFEQRLAKESDFWKAWRDGAYQVLKPAVSIKAPGDPDFDAEAKAHMLKIQEKPAS